MFVMHGNQAEQRDFLVLLSRTGAMFNMLRLSVEYKPFLNTPTSFSLWTMVPILEFSLQPTLWFVSC